MATIEPSLISPAPAVTDMSSQLFPPDEVEDKKVDPIDSDDEGVTVRRRQVVESDGEMEEKEEEEEGGGLFGDEDEEEDECVPSVRLNARSDCLSKGRGLCSSRSGRGGG